jgi:hypothetical protein
MGASSSKAKAAQPLLSKKKGSQGRQYNLPDAREKVRYEPEETINYTSQYEASIDKFEYLIVFPLTETRGGLYQNPVIKKINKKDDKTSNIGNVLSDGIGKLNSFLSTQKNRISWASIKDIWTQVAYGTDEEKELAVSELANFWKRRTGFVAKDQDMIRLKAWQTIAREAILDKLTKDSGLQCKLTANHENIFCRVRAPMRLLELKASQLSYKLKLKPEIDPGSEGFWNRELLIRNEETDTIEYVAVELEEENKLYSRDEAVQILEKLYHNGKISPNELALKDETQAEWSLRIHALERIIDKVPISNKFPAYATFSSKSEKRHLYQTYPTVRGKTLFSSKDRIYLTKAILDSHFDLVKLERNQVITAMLALHDANRGEKVTKDILRRRWVGFWDCDSTEIGSPFVTHEAYEEDIPLQWYWRPFSQPFGDIREYFGDKIAIYFAWFGYYTVFLSILFCFSIAIYMIVIHRGQEDLKDMADFWSYFYFLIIIIWSEIFQQYWERENNGIKLKWGTNSVGDINEDIELVRPQFEGIGPLVRSIVNNKKMAVFPSETRLIRKTSSMFIIVGMIIINLSLIFCIFLLEAYITKTYYNGKGSLWITWGQSIIHAFLLQLNAEYFPHYVASLNEWENYRLERVYEDSLITKTLIFQVTNNFTAATITTFFKEKLFNNCSGDDSSCIDDLRCLLISIIVVRMTMTIWRIIKSVVYRFKDNLTESVGNLSSDAIHGISTLTGVNSDDDSDDEEAGGGGDYGDTNAEKINLLNLSEESDDRQFIDEAKLTPYEGTFNSFSESALQFGFVNLFSVAMPALPIFALIENFIILRINAWRLCALHRRPHVVASSDIGQWAFYIKFLSFMGVIWGCGIIIFAGPNFNSSTTNSKLVYFLGSVQLLFYFKIIINSCINSVPEWVDTLNKRNNYIIKKYIHGMHSQQRATVDAMKDMNGIIDDHVDVDALNLYDFRKGQRITQEEYKLMSELEAKRRELMRDIRIDKERLQVIYKTETFNENTGIGETKHCLPLGRLSVKLIEIEGLKGNNIDGNGNDDDDNDNINTTSTSTSISIDNIGGGISISSATSTSNSEQQVKVKIGIHATRKGTQASPIFTEQLLTSESQPFNDGNAIIDQVMGPYAPIRTIDAEVSFNILNVNDHNASLAQASIGLRELRDQNQHDLDLPLKVRLPNGDVMVLGRIFVSLQFQYSKVLPVRRRIYEIQGKLREVEKQLALLKAGKSS